MVKLLILLSTCILGLAHGQVVTSLSEVSTSKELFRLNLGKINGLSKPDDGALYVLKNDGEEALKIAEIELMRLSQNKSIWRVVSGDITEALAGGVMLVSSSMALAGRVNVAMNEKEFVLKETENESLDELAEQMEAEEKGFPEHLVVDERFRAEILIHQTKVPVSSEYESLVVKQWQKSNKAYEANSLVRGPAKNELDGIRKKNQMERIQKQFVANWTKKDLLRNNGKYKKAFADESQRFDQQKSDVAGSDWSKDLTEEELRHYVKAYGLTEQKKRREKVYAQSIDHEIGFHLSTDLIDSTSSEDEGGGDSATGFGFHYEFYLARINPKMTKFTLLGGLFRNKETYDLGAGATYNAQSSEKLWQISMRYYLLNSPDRVNVFSMYTGLGIGIGSADVSRDGNDGEYSVLKLPYIELGLKYKDKKSEVDSAMIGLAYFAQFSYEAVKFDLDFDQSGAYADEVSLNHLNFIVGAAIHF